jgi:uncharacterized protein
MKYRAFFTLACGLLALSASAQTLGGISYEPKAALNATQAPIFDPKSPPSGPGAALRFAVAFRGAGDALVMVPGLLTQPATVSKAKRPAVILLHGLGGDKNQLALFAMMLSRQGFVTLSIDAAGHGERPKIHQKPVAELSVAETHLLAAQTIQDLRRSVDYLVCRPDVDSKRIGFVGVSLGGILGARFLAAEPRVTCAALWAAGGDWGTLIATSQHPWAKAFRARGESSLEAINLEMHDVDPKDTMALCAGRSLLFLNGDKDDVVPKECTKQLTDAAREPKEVVCLPGGHIPDLFELTKRTIAFLQKNLAKH